MLVQKQKICQMMFITFIVMITLISLNLTYNVVFTASENGAEKTTNETQKISGHDCPPNFSFSPNVIQGVLFKFIISFFAGGIFADPRLIKLGIM